MSVSCLSSDFAFRITESGCWSGRDGGEEDEEGGEDEDGGGQGWRRDDRLADTHKCPLTLLMGKAKCVRACVCEKSKRVRGVSLSPPNPVA